MTCVEYGALLLGIVIAVFLAYAAFTGLHWLIWRAAQRILYPKAMAYLKSQITHIHPRPHILSCPGRFINLTNVPLQTLEAIESRLRRKIPVRVRFVDGGCDVEITGERLTGLCGQYVLFSGGKRNHETGESHTRKI